MTKIPVPTEVKQYDEMYYDHICWCCQFEWRGQVPMNFAVQLKHLNSKSADTRIHSWASNSRHSSIFYR